MEIREAEKRRTHVCLLCLVHGERLKARADIRGRDPCLVADRGTRVRGASFKAVAIGEICAGDLDGGEDGGKEREEASCNHPCESECEAVRGAGGERVGAVGSERRRRGCEGPRHRVQSSEGEKELLSSEVIVVMGEVSLYFRNKSLSGYSRGRRAVMR